MSAQIIDLAAERAKRAVPITLNINPFLLPAFVAFVAHSVFLEALNDLGRTNDSATGDVSQGFFGGS